MEENFPLSRGNMFCVKAMNQNISEKQIMRDYDVLSRAIQALEKSAGIHTEITKPASGTTGYEIEISLPDTNKKKGRTFLAEVKRNLSQAALGEVFIESRHAGKKFILVSEYIAPGEAEMLRDLGIAFFDAVGNAYFNNPGLYVYVSTKKRPVHNYLLNQPEVIVQDSIEAADDLRPSDIKIIFAMLSDPDLEKEDYRTIAICAKVALGTVAKHITRLKNAGFLGEHEGGQRRLLRKPQLFKLWVDGFIKKLRPKLLFARFEQEPSGGRWWQNVEIEKYQAVWGGETGAEILTKYLKPQVVTIYADSVLPRLQAQYGLKRRADGDIEILQKFWGIKTESTAPPLIVYADLIASGDSRNLEAAKIIYDKYLIRLIGKDAE